MKNKPLKPKQTRQAIFEKINWINQLRKISSLDDEIASEMLEAAAYSGDEKLFSTLENLLTLESIDNLINPDPFRKGPAVDSQSASKIGSNGIYIGEILSGSGYAGKLVIPIESFAKHSLIVGSTGEGKSFLIKFVLPQLIARGITVVIFDSENEYKDLLGVVGPEKILIFDAHATDRENILEPPPGVTIKEWISKLKNIFREVFYLRDGAINLLGDVLTELYRKKGCLDGGDDYPTIADLLKSLYSLSYKPGSRHSGYLESLINRFKGLIENLGDVICCKKGFDLTKEKEGKIIVFRTGSLSDDAVNLFVPYKLLKEASYREKLPPQGPKIAFVIEEAHTLYNSSLAQRYDLGEPFTSRGARLHRKRGIFYIYSDQVPSELPAALSANVNNNFVFKIVHGPCIRRIAQSINLLPEQAEYLPVMPKRHCIFHSGDYPDPVLVEIPELCFPYISEDAVKSHMESILARLDYTPADETAVIELSTGMSSFGQNQSRKSNQKPNQIWKKILNVVAEKQPISLTEIYQDSGVDHWAGRKILESMEKQDLIEACAVGFGARGNPKTFVVLKPKGAEFIGADYDKVKLAGKGNTEHVILQNLLAQAMRNSGKTVSIEYYANEKSVDICEIRDDRSIAYEIELQPSHPHVAENIRKDFQAGFSQVVVITKNKASQIEAKNRIVAEIEWEKLSKVEFKFPKDFLKSPVKKEL
ncbi:MAG: ATP-binding protein [Candidatus Aminicenantes bacterium]|jgi:DNA helicase HerA-like ATPase